MSLWQCSGNIAALSLGGFSAKIDLTRPWLGLHEIVIGGHDHAAMRLLRINSEPGADAESILDQYVRNEDLVVSYAQTDRRPVSLHTYWRALVDTINGIDIAGVDLIVSMQTDRLESDPRLQVASDVPTGEIIRDAGDTSRVLLRPSAGDISMFLAAHPSDCEAMESTTGEHGVGEVTFDLFRPGLEKGVIRRARLRAAIIPREGDEKIAAECFASFLAEALPLTT